MKRKSDKKTISVCSNSATRISYIIFFFYTLCILVLTVYPRLDVPYVPSGLSIDKVAHVIQFFIFSLLYFRMRIVGISRKEIYLELFFLGAILSVFFESLQRYIPGRSFCWYDILSNLFGFYLFILVSIILKGKK